MVKITYNIIVILQTKPNKRDPSQKGSIGKSKKKWKKNLLIFLEKYI